MGAHSFLDSAIAPTAAEAYQKAVDQAYYDYGHEPYNGTISTTSGFTMISIKEGESMEDWEERVLDEPDVRKWDNCACTEDPIRDSEEEDGSDRFWRFAGWAAS